MVHQIVVQQTEFDALLEALAQPPKIKPELVRLFAEPSVLEKSEVE